MRFSLRSETLQKLIKYVRAQLSDDNFLHQLERVETIVSKILSIAMIVVILVSVYNLGIALFTALLSTTTEPTDNFGVILFNIFGMFLNVLIALEILENITAYLKKHVIQVELVIVTSLIAVARKIIILDLEKKDALDLIALAVTIAALSVSYWIIRHINQKTQE